MFGKVALLTTLRTLHVQCRAALVPSPVPHTTTPPTPTGAARLLLLLLLDWVWAWYVAPATTTLAPLLLQRLDRNWSAGAHRCRNLHGLRLPLSRLQGLSDGQRLGQRQVRPLHQETLAELRGGRPLDQLVPDELLCAVTVLGGISVAPVELLAKLTKGTYKKCVTW